MAELQLVNLSKIFDGGVTAVDNLCLEMAKGELLVLVGPSGCGKSTTLRMVAGLESPTSGKILIDKNDITLTPPGDRKIGMVFQNYALYPHKTIYENLAFGLKIRKVSKEEIKKKITEIAAKMELQELLNRLPNQLSGGQKQRVALARALLREGNLILFDEPLSNLDASLRQQLRVEIASLHREKKFTAIFVTHDQVEAMTLGDRIAVMNKGKICQIGTPLEVYHSPANLFVASFIGSPAMNLFPLKNSLLKINAPQNAATAGIRPEQIKVNSSGEINWHGKVIHSEPRGADWIIHATIDEGIPFSSRSDCPFESGSSQNFSANSNAVHFFDINGDRIKAP